MKKLLSFFMVGAILAFASCTKENNPSGPGTVANGEEVVISIKAQHPDQRINTRAAFSDPTLANMRVILMVMNPGGKVVFSETKPSHNFNEESLEFIVRLVSGNDYTISCWADFGSAYYTVSYPNDAVPSVSLASNSISGSDNKRDAYFGYKSKTFNASEEIELELKRPFGLIKIDALDYAAPSLKNAGKTPNYYETTISAPTTMNLYDGGVGNPKNVTILRTEVATTDKTELSFDYFFASEAQSTLGDFTVKYFNKEDGSGETSYTFRGIPIRRNYKTLITGNLFTVGGDVKVKIKNGWNTPDIYYAASLNQLKETLDNIEDNSVIQLTGSFEATLDVNPAKKGYLNVSKNGVKIIGNGNSIICGTEKSSNNQNQTLFYVTGEDFEMEGITLMPKPSDTGSDLNQLITLAGSGTVKLIDCKFVPNTEVGGGYEGFAGSVMINTPINLPTTVELINCNFTKSQVIVWNCSNNTNVNINNCNFVGVLDHPNPLDGPLSFAKSSIISSRNHDDATLAGYAEVKISNCRFDDVSGPVIEPGTPYGGNLAEARDASKYHAAIRPSYGKFVLENNKFYVNGNESTDQFWYSFRAGTIELLP